MEQSAAMLFALEGSRPYGERLAGHLWRHRLSVRSRFLLRMITVGF
jgi:hypothetical protein